MEYKDRIRKFIESNLIVFDDDVTFSDTDNIFQLGFVNSLFAMKLLNYVETEFGLKVNNEEMDIKNFSSIENIFLFIQRKKETTLIDG